MDITNAEGQDLGKIGELIIDLELSAISLAILSHGRFVGILNSESARKSSTPLPMARITEQVS